MSYGNIDIYISQMLREKKEEREDEREGRGMGLSRGGVEGVS